MDQRIIKVRGTARISAEPDWVVISFNINSRSYDYGECLEQLSLQTSGLREELVSVGLEKENLKTTRFDVNTVFERVKERRVFKGYEASHDLQVEFSFAKEYLNSVLRVLGHTQSKASFDISFQIRDPEPWRHQAIAEAVKNSRQKAIILAEAAGVELGEVLQIDYSWSEMRFRSEFELRPMKAAMAAPAPDFEPTDVGISESVTLVWAIR